MFQDRAMKLLTVVVHGALGKMGREVADTLCRDPQLEVVGAVDLRATEKQLVLPNASKSVLLSPDLKLVLNSCRPQVLVDFTVAEAAMSAARIAIGQKINVVIGTSGLSSGNLMEIEELAKANKVGAMVVPNFAIGAVLLLHLAKAAAKFFDNAEIIELHHQDKVDAPSGTALATAQAMIKARGKAFDYPLTGEEKLSGSRGGQIDGVAIHSVRLPGIVASQEVIFGGQGQTLSLRHDVISRECYIPGVILSVKEVIKRQGLVYGLDAVLNLGEL